MKEFADKYDWTVSLDPDIYPLESIQLAACGFLDDAFFYLFHEETGGGSGQISVAVKSRDAEKADIEVVAGRFTNELNRQSLRLALNKMNRKVRTQIVGRALTSAIPAKKGESSGTEKEDGTG